MLVGMSSASFQQTISDGAIRLPEHVRSKFAGTVNVIVWQENEGTKQNDPKGGIMRLIRNPVRVKGFRPLSREECHERGR